MIRKKRICWKFLLLILAILLLFLLLSRDNRKEEKTVSVEKRVPLFKVQILLNALFDDFKNSNVNQKLEEKKQKEEYLTYEQMQEIHNYVKEKGGLEEEDKRTKKTSYLTKEEWDDFYSGLLEVFDQEKKIEKTVLVVLGNEDSVEGSSDNVLKEGCIFTDQGIFSYEDSEIATHLYEKIVVYKTKEILLTYEKSVKESVVLENCWLIEAGEASVKILSDNWILTIPYEKVEASMREHIADLIFENGKVEKIKLKKEKISGKILTVKEKEIEIEGVGKFPLAENGRIYRLYDNPLEQKIESLIIGYQFADFVIEDGEIVAGLLMREDTMENIRVLLKTSEFAGDYHLELKFDSDSDLLIRSGDKEWRKQAGEEIVIIEDSEFFVENRIKVTPLTLSAKTMINTINRSQGTPSYRGSFEIEKTKDGLLCINELPLEEYLYAVVPSEMPASYPIEALKAQAICARTYAYRNLSNPSMAALGANVDDSVAYQVYNNILENSETTRAVKETKGQVIYYQDTLAGTYYYSTSCGFGSNIEVWGGNKVEEYPYLEGKHIGETSEYLPEEILKEEVFTTFIKQKQRNDWESEEGWYRWEYEVSQMNSDTILERLRERYKVASAYVLTRQKDGTYCEKEIEKIGEIRSILVLKRNAGGVCEELLIEGTKNSFLVKKEYNIRYVLSDRTAEIRKQNGESLVAGNLLPSAYFIIEPIQKGEKMDGYKIIGGGYGHGVGMSQNGAKQMALKGYQGEEIIAFFYEGGMIKTK